MADVDDSFNVVFRLAVQRYIAVAVCSWAVAKYCILHVRKAKGRRLLFVVQYYE